MSGRSGRRTQTKDNNHFRTHAPQLIDKAQHLRAQMTTAERRLWGKLSRDQTGHQFRRQHPIDHYIVDFICIKQRLIIELDGGQHNTSSGIVYDEVRTEILRQLGYRVLRFWNNDVMENMEGVYSIIIDTLSNNSDDSDPHPSSP